MSNMDIAFLLEPFQRLRRFIGVDKPVFYSIISRIFSTAGSLVTIPLILTRLTSVEQGFYYTFGSILALQVFLEMGFGTVAIQLVAHEAAQLTIDLESGISGNTLNLGRFSATIRFIRNWYVVVGILVGILVFPIGFYFFSTSAGSAATTWLGPWAFMVLTTVVGVFVNCFVAIVEGMGFVAESIRVRLWGGAAQIFLTIAGLLAGFKLYSVPLASSVGLIINFCLVWRLLHNVFKSTSDFGRDTHIDWFNEVFPFQWRIALSWVSGWFIFNAMLPIVFRQMGPEEAGRFGLAMSISGFISTLATNWTSTKSAIWGQMVSRKEWMAMDSLFFKVMPQSVGLAIIASVVALFLVPDLANWMPRFAGRVPEWRVLFMLCSVTVMNQLVFAEAFYLRAHKREPFLANTVFMAVAMSLGLFKFSHTSAFSVSAMYASLSFVGTIWASSVFLFCRSRWHSTLLSTKGITQYV